MSIWVMAFIGGILCTQIANPFFWYRLAKSVINYNNSYTMREFRKRPKKGSKPKYRDYLENEEIGSITVAVVGNIICFLVCGTILWLYYYSKAVDRTVSMILATAWLSAIGNFISTYLTFRTAREFRNVEFLQSWAITIVMLITGLALLIHRPIYNFYNHVNANTFLTETEVPVISVDVSNTLEKEVLIQGYTLRKPLAAMEK